jgi:hypothetical protein
MTSTTETPVKTSTVARALADVLGLGLPEPTYATASDGCYPCMALLFSSTEDPVGSLNAWAGHFAVPLVSRPDQVSKDGTHYIGTTFDYAGIEVAAFAYITPGQT